jgi:hypothetical protein
LDRVSERTALNTPYKEKASMTKKLTATLLMAALFAGPAFAQTTGRAKELKTLTIRIDGFMKSNSGAI